jgi:diguanylate cyclase (GGDEF)-like protein/PAS domain S-box-containing protein
MGAIGMDWCRPQKAWLQVLASIIPDHSICALDAEGRVVVWTVGLERVEGWREEDVIGRHFSCFFASEAVAAGLPEALLRQAVEGRVEVEGWRLRGDGTRYWAAGVIAALRDDEGLLCGYCRVVRDLPERGWAEAALDESEARLKAIVDTAVDGILTIYVDGIVQSVNPAAVRIFGYAVNEVVGHNVAMLMPEPYRSAHDRYLANYLRTGEAKIIGIGREVEGLRKDGTVFPLELAVSEVRLADRRLFTGIVRDISERKRIEAQVRHMALHDELTGLPNRRLLDDRLAQALAIARREGVRSALMIVDLDDFKQVNDRLGHPMGDRLLRLVASRLKTILRESDTLARIGGDEFAIVLPRLKAVHDAANVGAKVIDTLRASFDLDGHEVRIGASIGVAFAPEDGTDAAELVRRADVALYRAKRAGRDQYHFFEPTLDAEAQSRHRLEGELRLAIDTGALSLAYQPQFELAKGRLCGVEALARWEHPRRGVLMPDRFIPSAEGSGLICRLGDWVLHEACRQGRAWQEAGHPLTVSVNLSGAQLSRPDRLPPVTEILAATGMAPELLQLEITESVLIGAFDRGLDSFLRELGKAGIAVAIDDFGIGYSSLAYLKSLPVAVIKIDRSFIAGIGRDEQDELIVAAVIGLGHSLRKKVVAEGVESEAQIEFLKRHGCDIGQGFLLGRPIEPERLRLAGGETDTAGVG